MTAKTVIACLAILLTQQKAHLTDITEEQKASTDELQVAFQQGCIAQIDQIVNTLTTLNDLLKEEP